MSFSSDGIKFHKIGSILSSVRKKSDIFLIRAALKVP